MPMPVSRPCIDRQANCKAILPRGASHYVFETEFCNPAAGWEKGQVEKNVRDARSRLWQVMPIFTDLAELNQWLEERCVALWSETKHRELPGTIADVWEAAMPMLSQLLKAEMAEREVRSIAYHTKVARFPSYKDLAGFDFKSSDVNEAIVRQLHRGEFMERAENVVLIGGPGTARATLQQPSEFRPSNTTGARCASTQP